MNERDEVEQQQFQYRQSTMKKEKKTSKTNSRFKSKLESLKKLPHSTSASSAIEKARTFFRSLDFKNHNRNEQSDQHTTTNALSSSNFISMNEDNRKKDSILNPIPPTTNISTSRISRVDKINPRDMIVHRVIHNDQNDNKLSSNYFQQKYKQYLKPSLLLPKQYYYDLANRRNQNYFSSINRYNLNPHSHVSNSNFTYSSFNYSITNKETPSHHRMSTSLYNDRPLVCRAIESSYKEQNHQFTSPITQSSSMLTWNQCVRRLNTEYRLTIDALQQAKECLEQVSSNSRANKNLSNNETKKIANVTFCLPSPSSSSLSSSTNRIEQNKILPAAKFCKPKLIKPVELDTFLSSSKLEPALSIVETDEKLDSITNIIKKFNDLSSSLSQITLKSPVNKEQPVLDDPIINPHVHFKPSITTDEFKEIPNEPPPPLSSELVSTSEEHPLEHDLPEEETTYTVETFYQSSDDNKNDLLLNNQNVVIIQENTTEEQFNLAQETNHNTSSILLDSNNKSSSSSSTPLKNNNKSISHIPKRITTTNVSRLKQPSKAISSSSKLKPPSSTIASIQKPTGNIKTQAQSPSTTKKQSLINSTESPNRTDSTSSIHVKSMVRQLNTNSSSRSLITNKRTSRPLPTQQTTSTNKNLVQRK